MPAKSLESNQRIRGQARSYTQGESPSIIALRSTRVMCRKGYHTRAPRRGGKRLKTGRYSLTFAGVLSAFSAGGRSILVNTGSDQGPVTA